MRRKLIAVALIAILLCMIVGNIIACGPTVTQYDLTVSSTEGGDVTTPAEGTHTYDAGEEVDLVATPDSGYQFVNWTGDVGTIADVNAPTTTITMNGDYSITANFQAISSVKHSLTISSTAGGNVTTPGEGTHNYTSGTVVNLVATPDAGYKFVNWTGDVGTIANVNAAATTITMNGDYAITANFALGAVTYDLTTSSTAGGDVTTPGEGTRTYDAGKVVNLVATPDGGYRFVKWTGSVGTVANVSAAATTITMNGDYSITASFALGTSIAGVPDTNQPPTSNSTNYCVPIAMVNILGYWDEVMGLPNAHNVTAFLVPHNLNTVADYVGYFMDTNDKGHPFRHNGGDFPSASGTYVIDIGPGTLGFVRWDAAHAAWYVQQPLPGGGTISVPQGPPPPSGKLGYNWTVTDDYLVGFNFYKAEIDAGRPLVVVFRYWNPKSHSGISVTDPETGETIDVFDWGDPVFGSSNPSHDEHWNSPDGTTTPPGPGCIGHAVTGVGYILNWDPDGAGPYPLATYVIVHDNWSDTPANIAVPWAHWNSSHAVNPGP